MDFSHPGTAVRERQRAAAVARRLERNREGVTTRNFHRNQRLMNAAFVVLLLISTMLAAALLTA